MEQEQLVMPGDKIGVEEEFVSSDNTFVDSDGTIRAKILGNVVTSEGKISVINPKHNVKKLTRGMMAVGRISDDLRAVMFVKLDNIRANGTEYIALKDGKIVASQGRRPMGRDRNFGREREQREEKTKQCAVGDVILAKIIYEDPEIFTLGLNEDNAGVIYAECELCGTHLEVDSSAPGSLACPECKHKERRKLSSLYGKTDEITKLFIR